MSGDYRYSGVFDVSTDKIKDTENEKFINIVKLIINYKNLGHGVWTNLVNRISDYLFYELDNDELFNYSFSNKTEETSTPTLEIFSKEKISLKLYKLLSSESKIISNDVCVIGSNDSHKADRDFIDAFIRTSYAALRKQLIFLKGQIAVEDVKIQRAQDIKKQLKSEYQLLYDTLPDEEKLLVEVDFDEEI